VVPEHHRLIAYSTFCIVYRKLSKIESFTKIEDRTTVRSLQVADVLC